MDKSDRWFAQTGLSLKTYEKLSLISSADNNALVLHSRLYGEGREIVQFLSESRGKFAGVRRLSKRSGFQRLQPFTLGHVGVSGRSSLLTVSSFEYVKKYTLIGRRLSVGFLRVGAIQKLFVEGEPDPEIYHSTIKVLDSLSASDELERCLRLFEIELLAFASCEVNFGYEGASGTQISESDYYQFAPHDQVLQDKTKFGERNIGQRSFSNIGMENLNGSNLKLLKVINRRLSTVF